MTKPYRTGAQIRNDERIKQIIRDRMASLLDSIDSQLEAFAFAQLQNDTDYIRETIAELHQRKRFLRWIITMHKPNDPATVNQHTVQTDGETAFDIAENPRDCDKSGIDHK